jgi:four helix bundle suffix protein
VSVAGASLDELLLDYEDFLRQRGLRLWGKEDAKAKAVRAVGQKDRTDQSDRTDRSVYANWLDHRDPAVVANAVICLIHQANYLLDQQLRALERDFIDGGGYSERLAAARLEKRLANRTDRMGKIPNAPACPACGKPMVLRTARKGKNSGSQFWGCSGYPACQATVAL